MPTPKFTVSQAHWERNKQLLRSIREAVFIIEQRVPKALEWDDLDATALHVVATDSAGNGIGTGRLTVDGQLGRMAVLADWRNQGVGSALLDRLIELARHHGRGPLFLNAQEQAIPFYQQHGFHCVGRTFFEADIPHRRMELKPEQSGNHQESA